MKPAKLIIAILGAILFSGLSTAEVRLEPDHRIEPRNGTLRASELLGNGYVTGYFGGDNDIREYTNTGDLSCFGFIADAPDVELLVEASDREITVEIEPLYGGFPGPFVSFLMRTPTGEWQCLISDASSEGLVIDAPDGGIYSIWAATFNPAVVQARLSVERAIAPVPTLVPPLAQSTIPPVPSSSLEPNPRQPTSNGTGFFISADGYLLTSEHVLAGASRYWVRIDDQNIPATLVARDEANDIALLKVERTVRPLRIVSARTARRGEEVFVLGYPLSGIQGDDQRATFGRINALSGVLDDPRFIQIDAPILPGNSGGPVINDSGEVIGIAASRLDALNVLTETGSLPENVSYAVKVDYAFPLLTSDVVTARDAQSGSLPDMVDAAGRSVVPVIAQ